MVRVRPRSCDGEDTLATWQLTSQLHQDGEHFFTSTQVVRVRPLSCYGEDTLATWQLTSQLHQDGEHFFTSIPGSEGETTQL